MKILTVIVSTCHPHCSVLLGVLGDRSGFWSSLVCVLHGHLGGDTVFVLCLCRFDTEFRLCFLDFESPSGERLVEGLGSRTCW